MRLLLIPHTGLRNVKGDSNYLLFLDLAKYMISRGHFCYMVMPEYAREHVSRIPGLMYVWIENKRQIIMRGGFDSFRLSLDVLT